MRSEALRATDRRVAKILSILAERTRVAEAAGEMLLRASTLPEPRQQAERRLREAVVWDLPQLSSDLLKLRREVADLEHRLDEEPTPAEPTMPTRCHAIAQAITALQRRAVYTRTAVSLADDMDTDPILRECERAKQGAVAAEAALVAVERCLAAAEAELLAITASRALDHEAMLQGDS